MLLYKTSVGPVVNQAGKWFSVPRDWNDLINDPQLSQSLRTLSDSIELSAAAMEQLAMAAAVPQKPLIDQEVWAAGVTYFRSMTARMEESQAAGGGDFYDRVYAASRPEIFLKATPHRVVGTGAAMKLRRDSKWIVPEPELVLVITRCGTIVGYTIGNDLSCRDIEGENPLYLPQAKTFDRCAAIGPGILVADQAPAPETEIRLRVLRNNEEIVRDATTLSQMKRRLSELVDFLFRDNPHPTGCFLMTGTGIVPPDNFTLHPGDVVEISIEGIGTLRNWMET